jgi:Reverse transcriptase (RNA-dependent DNA polymerase)
MSARPSDPLLPRGVQETVDVVDEWEMVSIEEFVMVNVTEASEGIMSSFEEAKNCPDWPKWQEAIKAELANLKANGTWELIEWPSGANVVDSKWVLQIKKNAAGEIEKYKAHLVTRGFTQIYGVDFYETYAPVAKLATFHLITAIAACNRWPLDSFDFNSAYLNSLLQDEVIFLEQLPDHDDPKKP